MTADQQANTPRETEHAALDTQQSVAEYILSELAKAGIPESSRERVMQAFLSNKESEGEKK